MKYVDPDGKAVTKQYGSKFIVRAQSFSEKAIFEKLQSATYPLFGDKITEFSYWLDGERKINEPEDNGLSLIDIISLQIENNNNLLDTMSFIGDLDISKTTKTIGKIASVISYIQTGYELLHEMSKLENTALESFCCLYFNDYLISESHDNSSRLYLFAKSSLANMYRSNIFTINYNKDGDCINYKINNYDPINELKATLRKMQLDLAENY